MSFYNTDAVMTSIANGDDAGVFRVSDELALIQTVDVFTPVVDDPLDYGRIAAANSFSDCYAMGGKPLTALSVLVLPPRGLPEGVAAGILQGANEVCAEAGAPLIGGHTLKLPEPAFGLAVTGVVHPDRLITSNNARPGDALVLTKPIGTGIITTAAMRDTCPPEVLARAVGVMKVLNRGAAEAAAKLSRVSATDVTGFGLLGHLHTILVNSGVGARLYADAVPFIEGALELAEHNAPGGTVENYGFAKGFSNIEDLPTARKLLLCDAQTSGGLLIACPPEELASFLADLKASATPASAVIGEIVPRGERLVEIVP